MLREVPAFSTLRDLIMSSVHNRSNLWTILRDFVAIPVFAFFVSAFAFRFSPVQHFLSRWDSFTPTSQHERALSNWRDYASEGAVIGDMRAPATMVVFSDFECPYCRQLRLREAELLTLFPHELRIIYRHFPIQSHPHAFAAAAAAECASLQGRFQEFHDMTFDHHELVTREQWDSLAALAAISDRTNFRRCISEGRGRPRVERDRAAGEHLGVAATPTILFAGRMMTGLPEPGVLRQLVVEYLEQTPRAHR